MNVEFSAPQDPTNFNPSCSDRDVIIASRTFAIIAANELACPYARAKALFNLGIKGGTTRKDVMWFLANGTFA